jgi:hypothetical protein
MDKDEFLSISALDLINTSEKMRETYSKMILSKSEYDILKALSDFSDGNVNILGSMLAKALEMDFDKMVNITKSLQARNLLSMTYLRGMPIFNIKNEYKKIKKMLKEYENKEE